MRRGLMGGSLLVMFDVDFRQPGAAATAAHSWLRRSTRKTVRPAQWPCRAGVPLASRSHVAHDPPYTRLGRAVNFVQRQSRIMAVWEFDR